MALFYQSGRVSRFAVGVPGFSTNRDLVLDVDGALGIDTQKPRGSIDTPEISIRGDIIDSKEETGALGYFLTQDAEGVRWVAASPLDLTYIRVFENDVQEPGLSSATGLNFKSQDDFFLTVDQNPGDPNLADIKLNNPWIKIGYANSLGDLNFGLSTSFGPDGTFWSLPGYGTSEASGITSVGIGTNAPRADLQVGIGSTGVQLYGAEGRVEAVIGDFKNLKISGNIQAESLVIDPGIATFRGGIDAQGFSTFTGPVTADTIDANLITVDQIVNDRIYSGLTTLGVGGTDTFILGDLFVQGGISTFSGDIFLDGDLFVTGFGTFLKGVDVPFIAVKDLVVSGIATVNELDLSVGVASFFNVGVLTAGQIGFNTGIGTELQLEESTIGILTAQNIASGVATIGFASMTDAFVGGAVTVTRVDVEQVEIDRAAVGILTVGTGLSVTGFSTFIGLTTFVGNVFVDGDLTVSQQFIVKDLGAENLEVTGIGTIVELRSDVGIVTQLFSENQVTSGVGSFGTVDADNVQGAGGTIGGVGFDSGRVEADFIDADFGRIGILTGDLVNYQLGIITNLYSPEGIATYRLFSGDQLNITSPLSDPTSSFINGVEFSSVLSGGNVTIPGELTVNNLFGGRIALGDTSDPRVGLTTVAGDLFVGQDLFVFGTQFIKNLISENLDVSGIATINELDLNTGLGTFFGLKQLDVGLGTIRDFVSTASTISNLFASRVAISTDPDKFSPGEGEILADRGGFESLASADGNINNLNVPISLDVGIPGVIDAAVVITGLSTFNGNVDVDGDVSVTGLTTTTNLYVSGIATINELDVDKVDVEQIEAGIGTIGDLTVTGVTTFQGRVNIDDIVFINQEVTGVSTVTNQVITGVTTINDARIEDAQIGVATVGLLSATNIEATQIDNQFSNTGLATVGFATIGTDPTESALFVTGLSTFVGIVSVSGDAVIDGDLTVTGITTFKQLDAEQSQIGILTVREILDSNGILDAENVAISSNLTVTGLSTFVGFTTTNDVIVGGALTVVGDTTFLGIVSITDTVFINQEITGISTVNNLEFNVGVGSTATIGILTAGSLSVSGASTFTGVGTFQNDLYVSEDLYVEKNIIGFAASLTNLDVVGLTTLRNTVVDGALGVTSSVGIAKSLFVGGGAVISGGVTFNGNVDIDIDVNVDLDGNLDLTGIASISELRFNNGIGTFLQMEDLVVTGLSSLNNVTANISTTGFSSITNANIGLATVGKGEVGFLTVGTGSTTAPAFFRTGVGTIVGFTTYTGDVFIDGSQTITGVSSFSQLDAAQSRIGILTVNQQLDVDGGVRVVGFTTLNDFSANVGFITDINVSGVGSFNELSVLDLEVRRNLVVNGISTLGSANTVTGFTTVLSDLYVGGDLYVKDDIFKDEIKGRNALITGIATINQLEFNVGFGTTAYIGVASVGFLTATDAYAGILTFTQLESIGGFTSITEDITTRNLAVTGLSSLNNVTANISTTGFSSITNANIGIATVGFLTATDVYIGILTGNLAQIGVITATDFLKSESGSELLGVSTITTIESDTITNSGLTSTGTLFVSGIGTFDSELIVNGEATFNNPVGFNSDITITGGDITSDSDIEAKDLTLNGDLTVNGLTGLQTATVGFLTVTDTLNVLGVSTFVGVSSFVGLLTANNAFIDNLDVETLRFNVGFGTTATIEQAGITSANIGFASITNSQLGIVTVTEKLDYEDIVTTDVTRVTTNLGASSNLVVLPGEYRSAEFTITAEDATDIHSTKIHFARKGSNVFWNEYSSVFSTNELGTFDVIDNAGQTQLRVSATPPGVTTFTTYIVAHR